MGQFLYLYRMADAARQEAMGTPERAQLGWVSWKMLERGTLSW